MTPNRRKTDQSRWAALESWLLRRSAILIAGLSVVAVGLIGTTVYLYLTNIEQSRDITRVQRVACLTRDLSSPPCKREARRIVKGCFADKRCRRIIEQGRKRLRPPRKEKGVVPHSGRSPGQLPGPPTGRAAPHRRP